MSKRKMQPGRRQRNRGASLIEFTIVMALLFMLLFGIMEIGFMFSSMITVNAAAQQGARAVAIGKDVNTAVANGMTGMANSATAGQPGYRTITVAYAPSGSSAWSTIAPSPVTSNYQVRVTVTYIYGYITGSAFGAMANLASGQSGSPPTQRTITGVAVSRFGG